ncbi:endonuclease [Aeromicrobium sp. SMF47]|uniref:endonuclease/exonuclease/phosphatase family protein n=1 Tax=Aeromicrobium yanjiei TaxID=2662028 RepID=UPI00129E153C|nr:endonuclease/exonuclease/phosphatase family protein [Aeromicrobium yanjiei]MRJ75427.1 endonuclease [Aeromicrobium yanjiei]
MPPPDSPDAGTTSSVRLVSLNIASGRTADGTFSLSRTGTDLRDLDADVVALQEVDLRLPRSGDLDQAAVLAEACRVPGRPAWSALFAATLHGAPGPGGDARPAPATLPDEPSYGVALLTRLPVLSQHELRLAPARGRLPILLPPGIRPRVWFMPDEQRIALAAVLDGPTGPLTVVSTHLSFAPARAVRQLRQIRDWARPLPRPLVLLGDLNLAGSWPSRATGWRPLVSGRTFPASRPRAQLDHALADGPIRLDRRAVVTALGGGDHLGIVTDVTPVAP